MCLSSIKTESFLACHFMPKSHLNIIQKHFTVSFNLTATIFESGPMQTPWNFLAGLPLLPSCKLG